MKRNLVMTYCVPLFQRAGVRFALYFELLMQFRPLPTNFKQALGLKLSMSPHNACQIPQRRADVDLLPLNSTLVEGELLSLENVPIAASALAWAAGHDGVQTGSLKLPLERWINLAALAEAITLLGLDTLALLSLLLSLALLLLPATTQALAVVSLPPRAERIGVDLDNGGLGQGIGADEFVVRRVENDTDDADLAGDALTSPCEVARVDAKASEFAVAATGADEMDTLGTDTGVGGLAALLERPVSQHQNDGVCGSAVRVMHTSSCDSMRAWLRTPSACDASHERYWRCVSYCAGHGGRRWMCGIPHDCGW
jgi:hypothetical protein